MRSLLLCFASIALAHGVAFTQLGFDHWVVVDFNFDVYGADTSVVNMTHVVALDENTCAASGTEPANPFETVGVN
jgi:hypothetical protein